MIFQIFNDFIITQENEIQIWKLQIYKKNFFLNTSEIFESN